MAAGPSAANLGDPACELLPLVEPLPSRQPFERARDRVEPMNARAALTGARVGEIPHHRCRLADPAGARRQDDDRSGPEPRAPRSQVRLEQGGIRSLALAQPAAEEPADEEGADMLGDAS